MRLWTLLQLEPSALRRPDEFTAPHKLGADGAHLAATLYHLGRQHRSNGDAVALREGNGPGEPAIYAEVANRLSELIDDVRAVRVDRDEQRELLTLQVTGRDQTRHPARSLSDGTLRFLALTVLALDPEAQGVICLEEPENGIHPERLPAMLRLLHAIATDASEPVGPDNPLRQVIINTHSPAVVAQVPEDCLLMAELREALSPSAGGPMWRFRRATFSCLDGTWRQKLLHEKSSVVSLGRLLAYLNPVPEQNPDTSVSEADSRARGNQPEVRRRVVDRPDIRQMLFNLPAG